MKPKVKYNTERLSVYLCDYQQCQTCVSNYYKQSEYLLVLQVPLVWSIWILLLQSYGSRLSQYQTCTPSMDTLPAASNNTNI